MDSQRVKTLPGMCTRTQMPITFGEVWTDLPQIHNTEGTVGAGGVLGDQGRDAVNCLSIPARVHRRTYETPHIAGFGNRKGDKGEHCLRIGRGV